MKTKLNCVHSQRVAKNMKINQNNCCRHKRIVRQIAQMKETETVSVRISRSLRDRIKVHTAQAKTNIRDWLERAAEAMLPAETTRLPGAKKGKAK